MNATTAKDAATGALRRGCRWATSVAMLFMLGGCASVPPPSLPIPCTSKQCDMSQVTQLILDAAYRGDVDVLRRAAFALAPHAARQDDGDAAVAAQYWRSFASWLIVVNGQTVRADAASLDAPVSAAIAGFEAILARQPEHVEAQIALVGAHLSRVGLWSDGSAYDRDILRSSVARIRPLVASLRATAPRNPRAAWVVCTSFFPAADAAERQRLIALAREALRVPEVVDGVSFQPPWGRPELLVGLAWMLRLVNGENEESKALEAQALALRPDWAYGKAIARP